MVPWSRMCVYVHRGISINMDTKCIDTYVYMAKRGSFGIVVTLWGFSLRVLLQSSETDFVIVPFACNGHTTTAYGADSPPCLLGPIDLAPSNK